MNTLNVQEIRAALELVAAHERLAREYSDVPRPDPMDANGEAS